VIAGKSMRCYLFTLRLSFSGRAIHRLFLRTTMIIDQLAARTDLVASFRRELARLYPIASSLSQIQLLSAKITD
jgi:hypothetical protein